MKTLKIIKTKECAQLPTATATQSFYDVRSAFQLGDKIKTYNPWNKESHVPVKVIADKIAFQLHPENRALVPIGLMFDVPGNCVLKMFGNQTLSLKRGLVLANGVNIVQRNEEVFVVLYNISDSLVVIECGEPIAQIALETTCDFFVG